MTGQIAIEGIRCYAYHGCLEEEAVIGGRYVVDVYIDADLSKPCRTDVLADTIDYGMVHDVVRKEMAVRSNLIEHACGRIVDALAAAIPVFGKISVRLTKINPPVNGQADKTSVWLSFTRPL